MKSSLDFRGSKWEEEEFALLSKNKFYPFLRICVTTTGKGGGGE